MRSASDLAPSDAAGGRNLRLWAYGHVPIYVGVFCLAAGTVAMAGTAPWTAAQWLLYAAGIALVPFGLLLLRAASPHHRTKPGA